MIKKSRESGFTLIEVIVTLAILGIVIIPLISGMITSQKIYNESDREYRSIQLAQQYIEEIKSHKSINELKNEGYGYEPTTGELSVPYSDIAENKPYDVKITLSKESSRDGTATPVSDEPKIDIESDKLTWDDKTSNPTSEALKDGILDLTISSDTIYINGNPGPHISVDDSKVYINLKANIHINILNSDKAVEFYVDDKNNLYLWNVDVIEGIAPLIHNIETEKASDILYNITVEVSRDGKSKITQGSAVFQMN